MSDYGKGVLSRVPGEKRKDCRKELDFFRSGLKEYFHNKGAGHYRLDVAEDAVTMAFYPGASCESARTYCLA